MRRRTAGELFSGHFNAVLLKIAAAEILASIIFLTGLALAALGLAHDRWEHSGDRGHELGQLFGLAHAHAETPLGVYQSKLAMLPDPVSYSVERLLHLEIWLFGLMLLPLALVVLSFGFDMAMRDGRDRDDSYL